LSVVDPRLVAHLEAKKLRYCLIGAAALAARGYARFTADIDLLTSDRSVLFPSFWTGFTPAPELREGDPSDPLVGLARFPEPLMTDVIVAKGHAARIAVESAERIGGIGAPVPTALAIVLNKLEAGGVKDQQDIIALVQAQRLLNGATWLADVAAHLPQMSAGVAELWGMLQAQLKAT
jgi:hypothetical protein